MTTTSDLQDFVSNATADTAVVMDALSGAIRQVADLDPRMEEQEAYQQGLAAVVAGLQELGTVGATNSTKTLGAILRTRELVHKVRENEQNG